MLRATVPVPLDESAIDAASRALLRAFADQPAHRFARMAMEPAANGSWSVVIQIPSPTNDARRHVELCLVGVDRCPTMQFGGWHTHADLWDRDPEVGLRRMLDYLARILGGTILLSEVPTVGEGLPYVVVDTSDPDELLEHATSPYVPSHSKLLSWSGQQDRIVDA